jgi:polar amino acid transport system substrate-binding protein
MKAVALALTIFCLAGALRAEEMVELKTESYPPFSYRDADGTYKGTAIEQVETIMRDAHLPYSLEMLPWARAIALAETKVNNCVFTTAMTPDRENRFKWVIPLSTSPNILVRHIDSDVRAATIDDAKRYMVGTHRGDYTEGLLTNWGFQKIDISADFDTSLRKLLDRRIDMMPMSENVYDRLKRNGTPVEKVMQFALQQFGIACQKDMADETIARMQNSLDAMKRDGRMAEIYRRYGLNPPK